MSIQERKKTKRQEQQKNQKQRTFFLFGSLFFVVSLLVFSELICLIFDFDKHRELVCRNIIKFQSFRACNDLFPGKGPVANSETSVKEEKLKNKNKNNNKIQKKKQKKKQKKR